MKVHRDHLHRIAIGRVDIHSFDTDPLWESRQEGADLRGSMESAEVPG